MVSFLIFNLNGGSAMKRVWDTFGLVTCWSLAYNELQLLKTKPPRNHLGYAHGIPYFCCDTVASILNFFSTRPFGSPFCWLGNQDPSAVFPATTCSSLPVDRSWNRNTADFSPLCFSAHPSATGALKCYLLHSHLHGLRNLYDEKIRK
jgi:hypothetical protein